MIVVAIIAIISAIAIPSLMSARVSGNEASAVSSLRTLSTVSEQFRARFQTYPGTGGEVNSGLEELSDTTLEPAPYIDGQLGAGTKSGYAFTYSGTSDTWNCFANPVSSSTGTRAFYVSESGVIMVNPTDPQNVTAPTAAAPGNWVALD